MLMDDIAIVAAKRSPLGAFQGSLSGLSAPETGAQVLRQAAAEIGLAAASVQELWMGCVLPAGLGQAPARQVALLAGLAQSTTCTTVNKVCGSGMRAIMSAIQSLLTQQATIVAAGGMESMTNAPYMLAKARSGLRMGHGEVIDHMLRDGLEDAYDKGKLMGVFAEQTAEKYGFSREDQDAFAIASTQKALKAINDGAFQTEIAAITAKIGREVIEVSADESPLKVKIDKILTLRPAFKEGGTVTAANSSSISDGAATLILMPVSEAQAKGMPIRAVIKGMSSHAHEPAWFTTAPVGAVEKLLSQVGWNKNSVDLYEINEAFAVVTMAAVKDLGLDPSRVNVHGGACALGHPIGATGARIVVTLLHALERHNLKKGIATLCIGGGEATALAIERP